MSSHDLVGAAKMDQHPALEPTVSYLADQAQGAQVTGDGLDDDIGRLRLAREAASDEIRIAVDAN